MRLRWGIGIGVALLLAAGVAVFLDPTAAVLGRLRGEPFYRGRPAAWWGRQLRSTDPAAHARAEADLQAGGADAVPVLVALLHRDGGDWGAAETRWMAADQLGRISAPARDAVPALTAALNDADPHVREVAAKSLLALAPDAEDNPTLLAALLGTGERLRAMQALGRLGAGAGGAVPAIAELLHDPDPQVRWNAARTLVEIGSPNGTPPLRAALKDDDARVREHAAEALGEIGPGAREAVPALVEALRDPEARVRRDAARSLGQLGPAAAGAAPALRGLLHDDNPRVRSAAAAALKRLTPDDNRKKP